MGFTKVCQTPPKIRGAGTAVFNYSLDLSGDLTDAERHKLSAAAATCPVHKTLSKKLTLQFTQG